MLADVPDPLLPATYDVAWTVVTLAIFAAIAVAIVLLVRRSRRRSAEVKALRAEVDTLKSRDAALRDS
ncbi:hypothetical protein [Demequina sp. SO4-18]|uniref:hypothetical protein n=1 Tax=Demequina sp. SO4-18 TaxID=3401026 RepID=UPI003B5A333C